MLNVIVNLRSEHGRLCC